jgi:hypothetical protein
LWFITEQIHLAVDSSKKYGSPFRMLYATGLSLAYLRVINPILCTATQFPSSHVTHPSVEEFAAGEVHGNVLK